jgi:hypothetical protein
MSGSASAGPPFPRATAPALPVGLIGAGAEAPRATRFELPGSFVNPARWGAPACNNLSNPMPGIRNGSSSSPVAEQEWMVPAG